MQFFFFFNYFKVKNKYMLLSFQERAEKLEKHLMLQ